MIEYIIDDGALEKIGKSLIRDLPELEALKDVDIGYQRASGKRKSGGQIVYADCRKVPEWLGEFIKTEYVVTFYEPAESLTEDGVRILMHHELLHIKIEDGKTKIRPHDIQDFRAITDVYGTDWIESFSRQMCMTIPEKEDKTV